MSRRWHDGFPLFVLLCIVVAMVGLIKDELTRPPVERVERPLVVPCFGGGNTSVPKPK